MRFIGKHARSFGLGRTGLGLLCLSLACAGGATACSSDDNGNPGTTDSGSDGTTNHQDGSTQDSSTKDGSIDAGSDAQDSGTASDASDASDSTVDAPVDAAHDADAGDATSATDAADAADGDGGTALTFCQSQAGLNFCNDFDLDILNPLATDGGASSSWTQVVGQSSEIHVSAVESASAPNSLQVQLPVGDGGAANGDRSVKVVEQLTPTSGLSQAIYEFDMDIANVPVSGTPGGFATDFQFVDTSGASDQFGFRIGVFANNGALDHVDLEHNHPVLGGSDNITSPIAGFTVGTWSHVKMVVDFAAGDAGPDGGGTVHFQLFVNRGASPALDATYPAPGGSVAFARFAAGMVFAFDGVNKDWNIFYDNFTLKIQ